MPMYLQDTGGYSNFQQSPKAHPHHASPQYHSNQQPVSSSSRYQIAHQTSADRGRAAPLQLTHQQQQQQQHSAPSRYMEDVPIQYHPHTRDHKVDPYQRPYMPPSPQQHRHAPVPASAPVPMPDASRRLHKQYPPPPPSSAQPVPRSLHSNDWYSSPPPYHSGHSQHSPELARRPAPGPSPARPEYPRHSSDSAGVSRYHEPPPTPQAKYIDRIPDAVVLQRTAGFAGPPAPSPTSPAYPYPRQTHQPPTPKLHQHSPSQSTITLSSQSPCPSDSPSERLFERPSQRRRTGTAPSSVTSSVSSYERGISFEPDERSSEVARPSSSRGRIGGVYNNSPALKPAIAPNRNRPKANSFHDVPTPQATFTTFMVKPSPATYEPVGATYMSTVDFHADSDVQVFDHGPTDLPPRQYLGGPDANSPWKPRKNLGTIPGSALDYLPFLEDRIGRLERAVEAYLEHRGQQALQNSILPGLQEELDVDVKVEYRHGHDRNALAIADRREDDGDVGNDVNMPPAREQAD